MSLHNETLTYIIQHLGLPLVSALPAVKGRAANADAEAMAKVLTSSVELGMAISAKMNIPTDSTKGEALRFKLTGLGAETLSNRMRLTGKEPAAQDLDSLKAAIDTLLAFAQNFELDDKGIEYLEQASLKNIVSEALPQLITVEALLPVISVIEHKDRGIFENVAARLVKESEELSKEFQANSKIGGALSVFTKQKIFQLLCQTFAVIYQPIIANKQPLGDVWQEFDRKKELILTLVDYLLEADQGEDGSAASEAAEASSPDVEIEAQQTTKRAMPDPPAISEEEQRILDARAKKDNEASKSVWETEAPHERVEESAFVRKPRVEERPKILEALDEDANEKSQSALEIEESADKIEEPESNEKPRVIEEPKIFGARAKEVEVEPETALEIEEPKEEIEESKVEEKPQIKEEVKVEEKEPVVEKPSIFGKPKEETPVKVETNKNEKPSIFGAPKKEEAKSQDIVNKSPEKPSIFGAPKKEEPKKEVPLKIYDAEAEASHLYDIPVEKPLAQKEEKNTFDGNDDDQSVKKPAMPPPPPMNDDELAQIEILKKQRADKAEADRLAAEAAKKKGPPPVLPVTPSRFSPPQSVPDDLLTEQERAEIKNKSSENSPSKIESVNIDKSEKKQGDNSNPFSFFKKDEDEG